jgi:putative nucleotidyltransferase with HDIG domain
MNITKVERIAIDPLLREVGAVFAASGRSVYLVGGAVRDLLRGGRPADADLATDAAPGEVMRMFRSVIPTGIRHGTVTVRYKRRSIEVTTFRTDGRYGDGRRPDSVRFAGSIEDDLSRRDFTMNAIAARIPDGLLVDPFGGRADIARRLVRCVGSPDERLAEDGLRALRAVRFASQLGFAADEGILDAIRRRPGILDGVSAERSRDELDKIVSSARPSTALLLMEGCGLLGILLPELARCRQTEQNGWHSFDVLAHSLLACDYAALHGYPQAVRLAALLHDIGKAETAALNAEGVWTFHGHEQVSERLTRALMARLRYSNAQVEAVALLVREHMFHYTDDWSDSAVRRFVRRAGEETLPALFDLRRADSFAMRGEEPPSSLTLPLADRVAAVLSKGRALGLRDLAAGGSDLIAAGIPAGKRMGVILGQLLEAVLDDPALNTKDALLEIARALHNN